MLGISLLWIQGTIVFKYFEQKLIRNSTKASQDVVRKLDQNILSIFCSCLGKQFHGEDN
jgi:hypothetical protein